MLTFLLKKKKKIFYAKPNRRDTVIYNSQEIYEGYPQSNAFYLTMFAHNISGGLVIWQ